MTRHVKQNVWILGLLLLAPRIAAADVVTDWNHIMLTTTAAQNPFAQARFAAITQLAVHEAVNACTRKYEPYLGTVGAPYGASAEAAAVAAAHAVLKTYFPAAAATLDAARAQSLAAIRDGQSKYEGIAVGERAAAAMIQARAADGATPPETFLPATTAPGVWQPTPPSFGPGILLHWRNLDVRTGLGRSVPFRAASGADQSPVCQGLSGGDGRRRRGQRRASAPSHRRRTLLCRGQRGVCLERRGAAGRQPPPPVALTERASVRVAEHGHQ